MSEATSTALPSFSHDQHHKTDAAKRKRAGMGLRKMAAKTFEHTFANQSLMFYAL